MCGDAITLSSHLAWSSGRWPMLDSVQSCRRRRLTLLLPEFPSCRTIYQGQFQGESEYGPSGDGQPKPSFLPPSSTSSSLSLPSPTPTSDTASSVREPSKTDPDHKSEPPLRKHVFQTIFLDKEDSEHLWSRGEIDKGEVVLEKWWKQQSHRWQHCESSATMAELA